MSQAIKSNRFFFSLHITWSLLYFFTSKFLINIIIIDIINFVCHLGSEVSESQLVRDLVYVFQGIDGHIVKFSHTEDAFRVDPQVSRFKRTHHMATI